MSCFLADALAATTRLSARSSRLMPNFWLQPSPLASLAAAAEPCVGPTVTLRKGTWHG